jgi:uncharacterized protein
VHAFGFRRLLLLVLTSFALVLGVSGQANAVSPNIVISQVYGGGGNVGATLRNDFMELANRGSEPVDVGGWSIQYASAAGTSWARTNLSGTIPPGGYYLVQQAAGTGGTTPLPTPDATGSTAMSATTGKVALVNNQTTLPAVACPTAGVVDFVGYGSGANCFEGAGPTPTLSNTTAALRGGNGFTDTDDNSADFTSGAPNPRNSCFPNCEAAPEVATTSPGGGASDVPPGTNITINFSEPVNVTDSWFTISCTASGPHTATVSGGPTSFTLDPDVSFTSGDNCTVTVLAAQVTDQDASDPPDTMAANHSFSFSVGDPCVAGFTPAYAIQGSGSTAALTGIRTTQGVVVGDFEGPTGIGGFYLQDATGDGNPATSDGIFVFTGFGPDTVSAGEVVRVTGFARERFSQTAIQGANLNDAVVPPANIIECGTGSVAATEVLMPFTPTPERYEGMFVHLPQELVISEYFNYGRFGEMVLGLPLDGEARHFSPTSVAEPGAEANALLDEYLTRRITLDDGLGTQNPSDVRHPNGQPFSLLNSFRGGDVVSGTEGVLGFDFSLYRIQPTAPAEYESVNPRPGPLEAPEGIRVATMNTLNFFLTGDAIQEGQNDPDNPADNLCGPQPPNHECRGFDTDQLLELDRQRTKLLAALSGLDADVIGLNELENTKDVDPLSDAGGIVPGLNALLGPGTYDAIDTGTIGTDAIKVGLIYRPGVVRPLGDFAILDSSVDPRFIDTRSRPVLAQTFEVIATGARFTVAVNHLKSKGSACAGDPDILDGQGNCNQTRKAAAEALVDWLATDPTGSDDPDFLIMGDLNSYAKEDPIDEVLAGSDDVGGTADDYTNLVEKYEGEHAYSFVFDGQAGYLDHGLANQAILEQVLGAGEWHINADEPNLVDYDTSFKPPAQEALFEKNEFRSADHDPLVVTLCADLTACATERLETVLAILDFLLDNAETKKAEDKIEDVVAKVEEALEKLEDFDRQGAAGAIEGATGDLESAVKKELVGFSIGNILLDELAQVTRLLAVDAIEEAKAAGGSASKIDKAEQKVARGDTQLASGRYKKAVAEYKDALSQAEGA